MLEHSDLLGKLPTVGENSIPVWVAAMLVAETMPPLLDGGLEFECQTNLFGLHDAVRLHGAKELRPGGAGNGERVEATVPVNLPALRRDASAKLLFEKVKNREVAVRDANVDVLITGLVRRDTDTAVSVEQASDVAIVQHQDLQVTDGMLANSVELRCPARKGAEGQYRAKQGGDTRPGVCNEHGPAPKGKMCSELGRNVERPAEMTGPRADTLMSMSISNEVTDCNTNYMHFVVDPSMLFEWSGPLSYPNQLAYTRLCGTRLFLRCTSRMFHAVLDGWTA